MDDAGSSRQPLGCHTPSALCTKLLRWSLVAARLLSGCASTTAQMPVPVHVLYMSADAHIELV